jgi:hypothetical protein
MSRSPAHLAAAAVAVRALAATLTADFAGLAAHSGPATWRGPAASDHRQRAARAAGDARAVAAELARVADGLDRCAADAAAVDAAAAQRQVERRSVAARAGSGDRADD